MPRPTVARIDLDAVINNVAVVRQLIRPRKVCAVVKADAYGHGAAPVCHAMTAAGVDMFGVAATEEALELRAAGIRKPIILLGPVPLEDVDALLDHDITAGVVEEGFARELSARALARGMQALAHVKIDTGMHRLGFDWETAAGAVLRVQGLAGLRVSGLFTHFAAAGADDLSFSREQVRRFRSVLSQLRRAGFEAPLVHMANSCGVLRLPEAYFDAVRPGLILYGLRPRPTVNTDAPLRPALSMRTRVAHLKRVKVGEKVGYDLTFTAWRDSLIGVIPIGYHDGYPRELSNTGEVLVQGVRVPVVGRICMDQTLIDLTDVQGVSLGEEVVLYGQQGAQRISVEDVAARVGRIPYELACAVGRRVRREFVLNGAVVVETQGRSPVPDALLKRLSVLVAASAHEFLPEKAAERGSA